MSIRGLMAAVAERFRWLARRGRAERDLDDELRAHFEAQVEHNRQAGMSGRAARRAARLRFGGIEQVKERVRDASGVRPWHDLLADLRFAGRLVRRRPIFAAAAVLTLGLGIGATTGLFAVINAVVFRPLPYFQSERLYELWGTVDGERTPFGNASPADLSDWQQRAESFESIAGYTDDRVELGGAAEPDLVTVGRVTDAFFDTLRLDAAVGRVPTADELGPDSGLALLAWSSWQRRFAADPDVVGRTVRLGEATYVIVAIVEPHAAVLPTPDTDLWVPFDAQVGRGSRSLRVLGRLGTGRTARAAQAELDAIAADLAATYPETNAGRAIELTPLKQALVGDSSRAVYFFSFASLLVFVVATINAVNLFHVGAMERRAELALRAAVGARRGRIVQSVVAEALLISALGGALGLVLATLGVAEFRRRAGEAFPRLQEIAVDPAMLAFAAVAALGATLLVGLLPALRISRTHDLLTRTGATATQSIAPPHPGYAPLLILEVAATFVLVFGAGLLLRSSLLLQRVDPGIDARNVISFRLTLPPGRYPDPGSVFAFHDQLVAQLRGLPGVAEVGSINVLPFGRGSLGDAFGIDGAPPGADSPTAEYRVVAGEYFRAAGMRLVRGRFVGGDDVPDGEPVAVVNETLARIAWPGADAEGRQLTIFGTTHRVVGIVADVRDVGLDLPPAPTVYAPFHQRPRRYMTYAVRGTPASPIALAAARGVVWSIDPELPLQEAGDVAGLVASSIREYQDRLTLLGSMGSLALVLSVIGIYGVTAQSNQSRRHEFAIRLALGAVPGAILRVGLRRGFVPVLIGAALGALSSIAMARTFAGLVHGVAPVDPATLTLTFASMSLSGLVAAALPSLRAARSSPANTLR